MKETKTFIEWIKTVNGKNREKSAMKSSNVIFKLQYQALFKKKYYINKNIAANPRLGKALYYTDCHKWVRDCRCIELAFK